ncbi:MAG TPA: cbb3-type cytochrome oxidase assembly protein CcoS [Dongiaceae bacterium]|jgi:cbb3-type cytochrome oxidase maturation protein
MSDFFYLIPVALGMGAIGLGVFLWSLRSGQYEDLDGAAERILLDEDDAPIRDKEPSVTSGGTRRPE